MWENNVFRYFVSSYDIQRKKFPPLNFTTLNFIPKEERFLEYAKVFVHNRDIKVKYKEDGCISAPNSDVRCVCDDCDCLLSTDLQHLCPYLKTRLFVKASVDLDAEVRSMYPEHDPSTANFCEYSLPVVGSCPPHLAFRKVIKKQYLMDLYAPQIYIL